MSDYILPLPDPSDPDAAVQAALDYLQANIPGYEPSDGQLETWLLYAQAFMLSTLVDLAQTVPASIFRYFGASLLAVHLPYLAPQEAVPATVTTTWTAIDTQGYTIPQGTLVAYQTAGDQLVGFTVDTDTVIPPGESTADAVGLTAQVPGAAANGLSSAIVPVDDLAWVSSITATGQPAGGVDAETDDAYLSRLSDQLELLAPRPIIPVDFAKFALNVTGVARAMAVDGYNPTDSSTGNERMVAVAVANSAGTACTTGEKNDVQVLLDGAREVNFVVNVMDATYTTVDVAFTGNALDGFDAATVQAAAEAAVESYLSPANWGPQYGPWPATVRLLDVASVIAATPGFTFAVGGTVTLNGSAADLSLTGVAPLPNLGTVSGTVT